MKRWIAFSLLAVLMLCVCGGVASANSQAEENSTGQHLEAGIPSSENGTLQVRQTDGTATHRKILVAYFSATGTTKPIAETMAEILDADIYEIVPAQAYSDADLNYHNDACRANQEQNDNTARPAISGAVHNMAQYDIVLIGHPIWWGEEPRILDTFMESYDWSGKTLANFCTSGGSGISTATAHLKELAPNAVWLDGKRFQNSALEADIVQWLDSIGVSRSGVKEERRMYIKIGEHTLSVAMAENSSASALTELLKSGDITVNASDYGNFEKVGPLGTSLPTNDEQITTEPGDVILYQGNQITIYYDTNTWSFTRLGKVVGVSQDELRQILGDGGITMILSLND